MSKSAAHLPLVLAVSALAASAAPAQATPRAETSPCRPVEVKAFHGKRMEAFCRLARIERGSVPCVTVNTAKPSRCRFTSSSGRWLESTTGARYAMAGQQISRAGAPGGGYVTASPAGKAPCVEDDKPKAWLSDTAGTSAGTELAYGCVIEVINSSENVTGLQMDNYATRPVCSSTRMSVDLGSARYLGSPSPGVYCFDGEGAGLNDRYGTERDEFNRYFTQTSRCHVLWSSNMEVPAAKRPATRTYPAPGSVNQNSPILWRPVSSVRIAN